MSGFSGSNYNTLAHAKGATGAHATRMTSKHGRDERMAELRAYIAHAIRTGDEELRIDCELQLRDVEAMV